MEKPHFIYNLHLLVQHSHEPNPERVIFRPRGFLAPILPGLKIAYEGFTLGTVKEGDVLQEITDDPQEVLPQTVEIYAEHSNNIGHEGYPCHILGMIAYQPQLFERINGSQRFKQAILDTHDKSSEEPITALEDLLRR